MSATPQRTRKARRKLLRPARTIFAGFSAAAALGAALLSLPIATAESGSASFIEALFTAVSALCVTGLVMVDTPEYWSWFGQLVIAMLIQLGGLGLMTFASAVGLALIHRMSLRAKMRAAAETKSLGMENIRQVVVGVIKISLTVEAVVFAILTIRLQTAYDMAWPEALRQGAFHAVSAFNNAGFTLFDDSLVAFVADPWVTLPISAAIILGGIGFPVIMQLKKYLRRPLKWTMHTRIVVWGTIMLLAAGAVFLTAMEWRNPATLGQYDPATRVLAGFVQSVQLRTAGFHNLDVSAMDTATWLGMDVLMFIGGGPAGTAGGIKITTFAVLFFIIVTEIRGDAAVNVFGKRLARSVHRQAISVALVAVALVVASTGVLMILTEYTMDMVLFEAISAFATVGLTTGITADLPTAGHLLLVVLMFVGRLGPITFAAALALRERHPHYELPKERPIIG